ncbi:MAG: hypothetical protein ACUVWR_11345 [Anaerolineae bacterium]
MTRRLRSATVPALLFTVLFCIYMLTYSGLATAADELSILAVSESLRTRGQFSTDQLAWAVWQHGWMAQGTLAPDGHVYSKKGPGISLLVLPLFALGHTFTRLGGIHTALLFNPIVTALTAVVLLALSQRLGYRQSTGLILGLIAGLGTISWPYSKTLFQEPATALLFLTAIYFAAGPLSTASSLATGVMLAAAITIKLTNAVAVPPIVVFLAYRLWRTWGRHRWQASLRLLLPPIAVSLISIAGMLYFNWARFGQPLNSGYSVHEQFSTPVLNGLSGLLFSSDKSIFIFSPVLLFIIPALPLAWRRFRAEICLLLAIAIANLFLFASWYDWRGGLAWGPRFLVPLTPILLTLMLPWVEEKGLSRRSWWWPLFVLVATGSLILQAGASLAPFSDSLQGGGWPISAACAALVRGCLDMAWGQVNFPGRWLIPAAFASLAVIALVLISAVLKRPAEVGRFTPAGVVLALASLFTAVWGISQLGGDSRIAGGSDYRALCAFLAESTTSRDTVIVDNHIYSERFLACGSGKAARYGFLRSDVLRPEAEAILYGLLAKEGDIWLVSDRPLLSSLPKPEETWLDQHSFRTSEIAFSDYARLVRYHQPEPGSMVRHTQTFVFSNGASLPVYQLTERSAWQPGDVLSLALTWQAITASLPGFAVSLQLLRPDGTLAWQHDSAPGHGLHPSSTWGAGELIEEHYGIPLPNDLTSGAYQLTVVLYDPETGERAKLLAPAADAGRDMAQLGVVHVQAPDA